MPGRARVAPCGGVSPPALLAVRVGPRRARGIRFSVPDPSIHTVVRRDGFHFAWSLAATSLAALLAGCAGQATPRTDDAPVDTSLAALAANGSADLGGAAGSGSGADASEIERLMNRAVADLEALRASGQLDPSGRPRAPSMQPLDVQAIAAGSAQSSEPEPEAPASTGLSALAGSSPQSEPVPPPPPIDATALAEADRAWSEVPAPELPSTPAAALSADDQLVQLASRMAFLLRDKRRQSPSPEAAALTDGAALASLETLRPGSVTDLSREGSLLASRLTSEDRATLLEARDRLAATPGGVTRALEAALRDLSPPPPLTITKAALATRVTGFGRFDAFASDVFVAGRPIRAIVYVEVDHFGTRPARTGDPVQRGVALADQVSVDLTQSLSLFHDDTGLLAWHRPAQAVVETSRAARRDFYLIQIVQLPPTLAAGRYNLKVTVKDRTTQAETEAIIPFRVVVEGGR